MRVQGIVGFWQRMVNIGTFFQQPICYLLQFLLESPGQYSKPHDLDQTDVFLFDVMQFPVRVKNAFGMFSLVRLFAKRCPAHIRLER